MGDIYYVPGQGQVNGGFVNVVGAETLKTGRPVDLGWLMPLVVGFLLAALYLVAQRRWVGRSAILLAILGVTALPLIAEAHLVFFEVIPAMLLVGIVTINRAWANFRQSYKVRGNINAVSGLPNLNALRNENIAGDAVLVAARSMTCRDQLDASARERARAGRADRRAARAGCTRRADLSGRRGDIRVGLHDRDRRPRPA